jgi:hypothetical protein
MMLAHVTIAMTVIKPWITDSYGNFVRVAHDSDREIGWFSIFRDTENARIAFHFFI